MNKKFRDRLRDNGLSLVLIAMFVAFFLGQVLTGWAHYNEENREHGRATVRLVAYLHTGAFGEAVFENWESEFLQMGLYVILTAFLFQRGSSESKDSDKREAVDADPAKVQSVRGTPWPVRRGGWIAAIYNHSLSIALLTLFAISFAGHAICGRVAANDEAVLHGQPLMSLGGYLESSQFWFESFQNWQSEFLAIFAIVVLSIWLREKGSPESKPVAAPHAATSG